MISSRRKSGHHLTVDMTPMIDIVFQLIIFFMLTSHLGDLRRTEVDLPREPGEIERDAEDAAMIVDISATGVYFVESQEVELNEVMRLASSGLAEEGTGAGFDVLIRPDRSAPAEHLDRLLTKLSSVGVTRWKLGTAGVDDGGGN
ncbi:MAG: ExbD/TolR family protein [Phycisphaerales bacterium]